MTARLYFHRDFRSYTGGHGKVWDYFNHAATHPRWSPFIYLTPDSISEGNPWWQETARRLHKWQPCDASALFVGGLDWSAIPSEHPPVINIVQHVRHADPASPLFEYLDRPAVRICVSEAVAQAILATGRVNGPVHVIPAAIDVSGYVDRPKRGPNVFIGAQKRPELGHRLAADLRLRGIESHVSDRWLPRAEYLSQMAAAHIAVLLPDPSEGFYLPGLEAMALGCATVMPDCVGNRQYVESGVNCLAPAADAQELAVAVASLTPADAARLVANGLSTATRYSLAQERLAFHRILDSLGIEG
ncbi:hypothetical protein GCM10008101_26420 [Lysobacter xinjiangensis]|uniref:Glycosyl transferases group 1 n=1 Tax=Cognatilysobacter xinjiangensis TaxID=546892 RepID=A0ABQ3CAB6_9GAMM|nr:glycosyltransferase [Lysobacter xinjiangensis]GGZ70783.1 hypothetical protein GCM10008101_26420 [Lysobacter xinjiangensis]